MVDQRNQPQRAEDVGHQPRVFAHLVHGTWPAGGFLVHRWPRFFTPRPTWFDDGSDFRRAIDADVPGITWRAFKWSGENSEVERRRAATAFGDVLRRELDSAPDACHVVIAHSHGGNVALWGLGELDETKRDRVAGLATMGTPFLHFAPHKLSAIESVYLRRIVTGQMVFWMLIFALPFLLVMTALEPELRSWDSLFALAIAAISVPFAIKSWRAFRRRATELEQRKPIWPERLASFVALRSHGDEASLVIAVAEAAGRAFKSAWWIVGLGANLMPLDKRMWRWKVCRGALMATVVLSIASLISAAVAAREVQPPPGWQVWLGLVVIMPLLIALFLAVMIAMLALLPLVLAMGIVTYSQVFFGLAFGVDTFSLAIATEIAAEPNPPRPAPVLEHVDPGDEGRRHSLHALSATRRRLAVWIKERRDARSDYPSSVNQFKELV